MRERLELASVAALLLVACSGQSRARFEPRRISVYTTPLGAEVYRVGPVTDERYFVGTTPVVDQRVEVLTHYHGLFSSEAEVERMSARVGKLHLVIEKPGYRTHQAMVTAEEDELKTYRVELERDVSAVPADPETAGTTSIGVAP